MSSTDLARCRRVFAGAGARSALVAALLASLAVATPSTGSSPGPQADRAASPCPHASQLASEVGRRDLRIAIRCLVNREREDREIPSLARDPSLQEAASDHAKVMVETDCLEHRCPDEAALETRLERSGYFVDAQTWEYAESTGCARTAEAMVESWIASREHRVSLLDRAFLDIGVGVVPAPVASLCKDDYATFAIVAAWRELDS